MSIYRRLPTSSTPRSQAARFNNFPHVGPYAPRPGARKLPEKSLVTWEDEGGSLADPPSV